jgi:PTS system mannose-specific IIA component
MIGILIASHGRLGEEMIRTAEFIYGEIPKIRSANLNGNEPISVIRERMARLIDDLDDGDGVIILTDIFGGTPFNVAISLMNTKKIEVVAGFTLSMVLKLATARNDMRDLGELARFIVEYSRKKIYLADNPIKENKI